MADGISMIDAALRVGGKRSKTMAKSKKWMSKAFANSHGQFKAKAEKAGKSTKAFAEEKKGAAGKTGKQARLALAGMAASKGKSRGEKWYGKKD